MATFSLEQIEKFGFEFIDDDTDPHYEYVLDEKDYFNSDYLYTEKRSMGEYAIIQYNGGEPKELKNFEVELLIGNFNTRKDGL